MKYDCFEIENYKGVQKASVDLEGRMNPGIYTLVGLNESGKTTLLEAVDFLRNGIANSSRVNATKLIPRRLRSSFTGDVRVTASLSLSAQDKKKIEEAVASCGFKDISLGDDFKFTRTFHYIKSDYQGEYARTEIEVSASKKKSQKDPKPLIRDEHPDVFESLDTQVLKLLPPVVYYSDFLYEFPSKIYIDDGADSPLQKFYKDVFADILASLEGVDLSLAELAERIKSPKGDHIAQVDTLMNQLTDKVTREVFSKWNEIFGNKHEGKKIQFSCDVEKGEEDKPDRAFIKVSLIDGPDPYEIRERSLGFKWFFAFLLLTIFRKHRKKNQDELLYLLDEPASNLHPTAQKKILQTLKQLGEGNSRLIYTTHSHFLINPEWLEGAFIVKNLALDNEEDPLYSENEATNIVATRG